MKKLILFLLILLGLASLIFLIANFNNINKNYTYIKKLEQENYKLYQQIDSLNNVIKQNIQLEQVH